MSTGLLVIDVQNDYFPGGRMEVPGSPAVGEATANLLRAFRAAGHPVLHLQHVSTRPGATYMLPGTPGVEIHPLAAPHAGEIVLQKHFPNGFRETGLLDALRARGIDRLVVICGMMTQMCVDATTRAAFDLGFRCQVAADACGARPLTFAGRTVEAAEVQAAFLGALGSVYAKVAPAADLIAEIGRDKGRGTPS
jgi:nicotinamidase-related amidase